MPPTRYRLNFTSEVLRLFITPLLTYAGDPFQFPGAGLSVGDLTRRGDCLFGVTTDLWDIYKKAEAEASAGVTICPDGPQSG